jgi:excisionase family DNA binding protein
MARNGDNRLREWISVEEAAARLGVSRGSAYKWAHEFLDTGVGLPCVRIGTRILVPVTALDALVAMVVPRRRRPVVVARKSASRRRLRSV